MRALVQRGRKADRLYNAYVSGFGVFAFDRSAAHPT
jgi:hypothetical protein